MDYIARLNKMLDDDEIQEEKDIHGTCMHNSRYPCNQCGDCFYDTAYERNI